MEYDNFKRFIEKSTNNMFSESFYVNVTENYLKETEGRNKGYVYFIKREDDGLIKIGMSKDVNQRFYCLNSSFNFFVVGFIYCDNFIQLEKELHEKFKNKRVQGEFFNIDEKQVLNFKGFQSVFENYSKVLRISNGTILSSVNKLSENNNKDSISFEEYFYETLNLNGDNYHADIMSEANKRGFVGHQKTLNKAIKNYVSKLGLTLEHKRDHKGRFLRIM